MEKKRENGFAHRLFGQIQTKRNACKNFDVQCNNIIRHYRKRHCCKAAFTLAEVLITLAVIGIVAALTIGVFLPKIHSTIRARQIATAEVKFTKAMEQMALNNAVGPYYETTQEFVDELQNYLKISKVCDNDKLEDCFGYEKIKADDEEFEIKNLKSGKDDFGMTAEGTDYAETIGIITIDRTSMLLSWDKNCPILEPKVYQWGENTNETTSCVAMVMDVNTDKSPNTLNKDVALFRANRVGQACGVKFSYGGQKYCWGTPFVPGYLNYSQCYNEKKLGINGCSYNEDYWAWTVKKCGGTSNMPSAENLAAFASYLFGREISTTESVANGADTLDIAKIANIPNFSSGWFGIWSNVEQGGQQAWYRHYSNASTGYYISGRYSSSNLGVCIQQ